MIGSGGVIMNLKSLIPFAFVMCHTLSLNISIDKTYRRPENSLEETFVGVPSGERIAQCLTNDDLKNTAHIKIMKDTANFELNRRFKVLNWRDGKITLPFYSKAWERIFQTNFTSKAHRSDFARHHWTPYQIILFGSENPLNITSVMQFCFVLIFTPHKDHLEIFDTAIFAKNGLFVPKETKGSPANGVIFPWPFSSAANFGFHSLTIKDIYDNSSMYQSFKTRNQPMKLVILIDGNDQMFQTKIVQTIRNDLGNMPICVVAQLDVRSNVKKSAEYDDSSALFFYGDDVNASTLAVDTRNEEAMRRKLLMWKEELPFLDTHQTIAFHFTMVNGNEPENSEQIFSDTFPNIQLSTLRLIGGPSIIEVSNQFETESRFDAGPVYAIVGFKKFGCGYSKKEYDLCDLDYFSHNSESSSDESE
ncbi:Aspartokinase [Dirofilaria immitis]